MRHLNRVALLRAKTLHFQKRRRRQRSLLVKMLHSPVRNCVRKVTLLTESTKWNIRRKPNRLKPSYARLKLPMIVIVIIYDILYDGNNIKIRTVTGKPIGNIELKTKNVHFQVQRSSEFSEVNVTITFENATINYGEAMNLANGVFTAPVPGIYHFSSQR